MIANSDFLTDDEGARLLAGAPWRRFVVLGDSVAEGRSHEPMPGFGAASWADRIATALQRVDEHTTYENLGVGGALAGEVIAGQLSRALALAPDLVAVAAGGNDALAPGFDPDVVEQQLDTIIGTLRDAGAEVIVCGLFDIAQSPLISPRRRTAFGPPLERLDALQRGVAAQHDALFIDLHHHPASRDPRTYAQDRFHASARAHAQVAAIAIRELGERLAAQTTAVGVTRR